MKKVTEKKFYKYILGTNKSTGEIVKIKQKLPSKKKFNSIHLDKDFTQEEAKRALDIIKKFYLNEYKWSSK